MLNKYAKLIFSTPKTSWEEISLNNSSSQLKWIEKDQKGKLPGANAMTIPKYSLLMIAQPPTTPFQWQKEPLALSTWLELSVKPSISKTCMFMLTGTQLLSMTKITHRITPTTRIIHTKFHGMFQVLPLMVTTALCWLELELEVKLKLKILFSASTLNLICSEI